MESKSLSFIPYNSTGLDVEKINWINDLLDSTNVVCFQLQEHFKATKSVNQFFKKHFGNVDPFVVPAVRDNCSHAGRPRGGLAQLVRKNIAVRKENIPSNSWRIQAQILHFDYYKILWLNVYMPTDPQLQQIDETVIHEVLGEIDPIMSASDF